MSRRWAKASACFLQVSLSCAVLRQIVSLQYLSRSSLHRVAGLPCHIFLSYGLQVVTLEVHLSSLRRLMCLARDHFIFLTLLSISYFCPLPDPDVGLSMLVCDIEHTSFHFGLCGRKFVLFLFGQCQMLQEVQIMEEALMIPPAPGQTCRHPESPRSQCLVTHPFCTRDHWIRYDTCTV